MIATEAMDKLFLELSQFTKARTEREIAMLHAMKEVRDWLRDRVLDIIPENDKPATQARVEMLTDQIAAVEQDGPYRAVERPLPDAPRPLATGRIGPHPAAPGNQ